ncbi:5-formyltetrahydrofolate cyclo-ligase [Halobaculum magnesiiphilum]|uniref:5-formyltetrahydrofolate cyclo-ligase n=1 Tax=Halobaculum magnesiiphilum TaxID=1017351 RepID=A0A8T8W9L1_9EURY|nr:5-formyltetrahydrofolate cyclo-ligase [Halobaculum magnesiiphilum]QZP36527.1 5-formyltetrahydrofolate cyclo-ligase [Halobaculum magnesiiphilum]
MEKQPLRERIWDDLEASGEARFPFPPHGRIPNFAGADDARDRLTATEEWADADAVKANPDAPQLPVRRAALRAGKTVYMAVPRLREEEPFLRLAPDEVPDIDEATTVSGSSTHGVPVGPDEVPHVDLIVSGSVAVTEAGGRVGKGEGFADLEFAVLSELGAVDDATSVATTVHGMQVVDEEVDLDAHDVPLDLICTPERTIRTADARDGDPPARPDGVDWDALPAGKLESIPVLRRLAPMD